MRRRMAGHLCLVCALVVAANPPEPAEPEQPQTREEAERLTGASPIEIIPRLELRHRFVAPSSGGAVNSTILRMDIEVLRRGLLRYELPLTVARTPDGQISGIGDIRVTALAAVASSARQLAVLFTGLVLNTATQPGLGAGKQDVVLGGGAALKPLPSWLVFVVVQEELSFAGDDARPDVNQLLIPLGNIYFGTRGDWYALELDTMLDFAARQARLLGAVETGRLFVGRMGLFIRAGTHLLGDRNVDYALEAGVRYLFRLDRPTK
jgi:hypothetical protein